MAVDKSLLLSLAPAVAPDVFAPAPVFEVLEPFYAEPPVLLIFCPVLFYLALVTSVGLDPWPEVDELAAAPPFGEEDLFLS